MGFNFGAANPPVRGNLYTVNLSTGLATSLGSITGLPGSDTLASIAVATVVPEPTSFAVLGLAGTALLRRRRA